MCRTPSRTHFFTAAELWLVQRCFFPHPVADLSRSIYAIQQCSLSLPLRLDLLPSITNVMFSLPHSFRFLFVLVLCFFSHTALWLFTHFSSFLLAWGKWAYRYPPALSSVSIQSEASEISFSVENNFWMYEQNLNAFMWHRELKFRWTPVSSAARHRDSHTCTLGVHTQGSLLITLSPLLPISSATPRSIHTSLAYSTLCHVWNGLWLIPALGEKKRVFQQARWEWLSEEERREKGGLVV